MHKLKQFWCWLMTGHLEKTHAHIERYFIKGKYYFSHMMIKCNCCNAIIKDRLTKEKNIGDLND